MMPRILHFPQMTIRQRFCLNRWSPYAISCIRRSASHSTPGREKISFFVRVSFQTCNDLVIGGISLEDSGLLQVWHRQDPAGFEYVYSLDFGRSWNMLLAPDGLTFIIVSYPTTSYSWNHDTTQFDPVHFDDQEHIRWNSSPKYSTDGKLFACWSPNDSHVRVWGHTNWPDRFQVSNVLDVWHRLLTCSNWPFPWRQTHCS